jgi:hypothetical protein
LKSKNTIGFILLLFVVASLVYMGLREAGIVSGTSDTSIAYEDVVIAVEGVEPRVIAYFFYGDIRCSTCTNLQTYTLDSLQKNFSAEFESGALQWRTLNRDIPENEHYTTEYGLYSISVVLVAMKDGEELRHKNLEEIWDLEYDPDLYREYIRSNTQEFLDSES